MESESSVGLISNKLRPDTVVAGFGSPHGDDQAGWQVVALLGQRSDLRARLYVG